MKQAIVLCSGGLDSTVTAEYVKIKLRYKKIKLLFFNYGQRNYEGEKKSVVSCASRIDAEFVEIPIKELGKISGSMLNSSKKHSKIDRIALKNTKKEGDKWYVPLRNTVFLTYALALAESDWINKKTDSKIFVGFKCEGRESYPDTTREYVDFMNLFSKKVCAKKFSIEAPLIRMDKEDIISLGIRLGVPLEKTFSCYTGNSKHCGDCLACALRKEGFYWANIPDKTKYS